MVTAKPPLRALLQSMLLDEDLRLQTLATHQAIELDPRQTHRQQAVPLVVVLFALHCPQGEELRPQPSQTLRQLQGGDEQILAQ